MSRAFAFAVSVLAAMSASASDAAKPVLIPTSAEAIRGALERLRPTLEYQSANIDHDHVLAKICPKSRPADCFDLRLDPLSETCPGTVIASGCMSFLNGSPNAAEREVVDSALRELPANSLWTTPVSPPPAALSRAKDFFDPAVNTVRSWFGPGVPDAHPPPLVTHRRVLIAVFFAVGLLLTWLAANGGETERRWVALPAALVIFWASFSWLSHVDSPPAHDSRSDLMAPVLECEKTNECFTVGPGSSVILNNGAVWPDLLLVTHHLGGDERQVYDVVIALFAAGIAATFLAMHNWVSPAAAGPSAVIALALLAPLHLASPMLDTSFTFFFCAAAATLLLSYALSGRTLALIAAAVFTAHACNAHVSSVVLLPALLTVPAMSASSPRIASAITLVTFALTLTLTSWHAIEGDGHALTEIGMFWPVVLAFFALPAAAALFNRRFRALNPAAKTAVVAVILLAPYGAGVLRLLHIGHFIRPEYLPVILAPLSAVLAVSGLMLFQRWPRIRPWAALGPLAAGLIALGFEQARNLDLSVWAKVPALVLPDAAFPVAALKPLPKAVGPCRVPGLEDCLPITHSTALALAVFFLVSTAICSLLLLVPPPRTTER